MKSTIGKTAFWSDDPPKADNAPGIQGVARHFCEVLHDKFSLLITRRFTRRNSKSLIAAAAALPEQHVIIYPDGTDWGARRISEGFAGILQQLLFACYLPILRGKLKKHQISRVFVLCGADGWIIPQIRMFQRFIGIPLDLYLVDDIEEWLAHRPGHLLRNRIHGLLKEALHSADRVFAISPGFKDHLEVRFGIKAEWLPLPSSHPLPAYSPSDSSDGHHRLSYIGNFSYLYADALRDVYSAITHLNETEGGLGRKPIILEVLTFGDSGEFQKTLPHSRWLSVKVGLTDQDCLRRMQSALACLLPYSFSPAERLMVTTSFSCKILEYFETGRPILAYGPSYASIPRYFRDNHWPLRAENYEELVSVIRSLPESDTPDLIETYRKSWEDHHSGRAITRILFGRDG